MTFTRFADATRHEWLLIRRTRSAARNPACSLQFDPRPRLARLLQHRDLAIGVSGQLRRHTLSPRLPGSSDHLREEVAASSATNPGASSMVDDPTGEVDSRPPRCTLSAPPRPAQAPVPYP